jgi:hypothetical protein
MQAGGWVGKSTCPKCKPGTCNSRALAFNASIALP